MVSDRKRQTIAIDIDDVLADNAKNIVKFSNERWGMSLTIDDYHEDYAKLWQVDYIETERRFAEYHDSGIQTTYEHDPSARFALNKLKDDYKLIVITARSIQTKENTINWINERYPGIFEDGNIYFAGIWDDNIDDHSIHRTKGEISRQLGADYLIDDQLKHCLAAAELDIQTILFGNYAWNRMDDLPQNVQRIEDWSGILRYFDELD